MKVLLTGANGHVGANTARGLLARGHDVVAFVRPTSDLRGLDGLPVTYAQGDVTDVKSLTAAAKGCDAIVHTAAVYRYWSKNPAEIERVAHQGTQNIMDVAENAGVKRMVYTSSTWAIGITDDPKKSLTTDDWNTQPQTLYGRAKTASERKAWELADKSGISLVVFCLGGVMGPYDYNITPSSRIVLGMADGSGQTFNSGVGIADARDVGTLQARGVDEPVAGKRYPIAQNATFQELGQIVTKLTGREVKHFGASRPVAKVVAGLMELAARITGKEPALTRALVEDMGERYMFVDSTPTWQAFQYTPRPVEETVRACLEWFVKLGKLPPDTLKG